MTSMQRHILIIALISLVLVALYTTLVTPVDFNSNPFTASPDNLSGNLYVTSEPDSAVIMVDGSKTGQITPHLFLDLSPGVHMITVTKDGYYSQSGTIEVITGKTVTLHFDLILITPESKMVSGAAGNTPAASYGGGTSRDSFSESDPDDEDDALVGSIHITSTPPGAKISMEGVQSIYVTPSLLTDIPPGTYTVCVSLNGYHDAQKSVTVTTQKTTDVHFDLVPDAYPVPEFSSPTLPVMLIIGLLTILLQIKKRRD